MPNETLPQLLNRVADLALARLEKRDQDLLTLCQILRSHWGDLPPTVQAAVDEIEEAA